MFQSATKRKAPSSADVENYPPKRNRLDEEWGGLSEDEVEEDKVVKEEGAEEESNMGAEEETNKTFEELNVEPALCDACKALGYRYATPIQTVAIPYALAGRDLIGVAETGSGKTAAFAIPILQSLLDKQKPFFALVLCPTRELAIQTAKNFQALGSIINARTAVIVGGVPMMEQLAQLAKKPHVVVATPGRLLDHMNKTKGFSLAHLAYLVLDEADKLLDLDFGPALEKIIAKLPRERRTYLFSATMSTKVEKLQRASLRDPVRVSVSDGDKQTASRLRQQVFVVPQPHKDLCLVYLMNNFAGKSIILFVRTFRECQRVAILLRRLGFGAVPLYGKLPMQARLSVLNKFRERSKSILVATDVAARGLDIPAVDLVVNFDLPLDSKTYVHRVGRTARAGRSGIAINIVTQYSVEVFLRIEHALGIKMEEYEKYDEELVKPLMARVEAAQREATREVKDLERNKKNKKAGKKWTEENDEEEG